MFNKIIAVTILFIAFVPLGLSAQQQIEGVGNVELKGGCKNNRPTKSSVNETALLAAQKSAIENFVIQSFSKSKQKTFYEKESDILSNPGKFITQYFEAESICNKASRSYTFVILATINEARLGVELEGDAIVANVNSGQKSLIASLFVARKMDVLSSGPSTKVKNDNVTNSKSAERSKMAGSSAMTETKQVSSSTASSSSQTITASDKLKFSRWPNQNHATKLMQMLTEGSYEPIASSDIEAEDQRFSVSSMEKDFIKSGKLSPGSYKNAKDVIQDFGINYFAFGTMDVGPPRKNPDSGLFEVYVTVNGEVKDFNSRFPKTVAAIGPVQFSGQGPDQNTAANNALSKAGTKTGQGIVDALHQKGLY